MQKILIADDDVVSRRVLEATLRKWGYEVTVACDGAEALSILEQENAPSLAILDWVMPVKTGPEVCTQVRQLGREAYTYILLLTAKTQKDDLITGMRAGADDYITKPFDRQELEVRLEAGKRILKLHEALLTAQQKLFRQATYDELTGIFNRARIMELARKEFNRAGRENVQMGIVLFDIDKFKSINDTHGHAAGDIVLKEVARRTQNSVRPYDALGRYGGEEFLLVLPNCDLLTCAQQAERLRVAICQEPITISVGGNQVELPVSASFGATAFLPNIATTLEHLIAIADEALYAAKRTGRNRVVAHPHLEEETTSTAQLQLSSLTP